MANSADVLLHRQCLIEWTPRFLTEDLKGTRLPPMSVLSLPTKLRQEVDTMGRTSVFSAFNLLLCIQATRLSMQVWISFFTFYEPAMTTTKLPFVGWLKFFWTELNWDWNWLGGAPFDNWVSSAYFWFEFWFIGRSRLIVAVMFMEVWWPNLK